MNVVERFPLFVAKRIFVDLFQIMLFQIISARVFTSSQITENIRLLLSLRETCKLLKFKSFVMKVEKAPVVRRESYMSQSEFELIVSLQSNDFHLFVLLA